MAYFYSNLTNLIFRVISEQVDAKRQDDETSNEIMEWFDAIIITESSLKAHIQDSFETYYNIHDRYILIAMMGSIDYDDLTNQLRDLREDIQEDCE